MPSPWFPLTGAADLNGAGNALNNILTGNSGNNVLVDGYPARAYAEASPERLDFLIDSNWGGETPRTEIIRADGSRLGISGELTAPQLQKLRP